MVSSQRVDVFVGPEVDKLSWAGFRKTFCVPSPTCAYVETNFSKQMTAYTSMCFRINPVWRHCYSRVSRSVWSHEFSRYQNDKNSKHKKEVDKNAFGHSSMLRIRPPIRSTCQYMPTHDCICFSVALRIHLLLTNWLVFPHLWLKDCITSHSSTRLSVMLKVLNTHKTVCTPTKPFTKLLRVTRPYFQIQNLSWN